MAKFFLCVVVIVSVSGWVGFYAYMSICEAIPAQVARVV